MNAPPDGHLPSLGTSETEGYFDWALDWVTQRQPVPCTVVHHGHAVVVVETLPRRQRAECVFVTVDEIRALALAHRDDPDPTLTCQALTRLVEDRAQGGGRAA
jgi:hypothetical protein